MGMSADFRTEHFKGYSHPDGPEPYIHVMEAAPPGDPWGGEAARGSFSLAEIAELVQMAGQAWAACPGVEVWFVIEARLDGGRAAKDWTTVWDAPATPELNDLWDKGVDEEFAQITFAGMLTGSVMEAVQWRLVRRTTVTHDEVLQPEGPGE
jgi:hypothetical protein